MALKLKHLNECYVDTDTSLFTSSKCHQFLVNWKIIIYKIVYLIDFNHKYFCTFVCVFFNNFKHTL